jgi:hypothetical protein
MARSTAPCSFVVSDGKKPRMAQLDVGDPEKILLMSRDSQTMIIVS